MVVVVDTVETVVVGVVAVDDTAVVEVVLGAVVPADWLVGVEAAPPPPQATRMTLNNKHTPWRMHLDNFGIIFIPVLLK